MTWTGIGVVGLAAGPLLAGCSAPAASDVSNAGKKLAAWPTYVANDVAKYDLSALPNGGAPGVLNYPSLPLPASVSSVPGDGSKVTAMTLSYGSPVSTSNNKLLQAVSKALGVDLQPNFVVDNGTSFAAAQTTLQAGHDLPDIIGGTNSLPSSFIQASCADLTPYLSGDAIKDYPNLASIPREGWELAGRIGGKIYTIPIYRYNAPGQGYVGNRTLLTAADAWDTKGQSASAFGATMAKVASGGKSAMGSTSGIPFGYGFHLGAAGVANQWSLTGGKFQHYALDPAFPDALANMQGFYKKGLFNPDALTASSAEQTAKFLSQDWASTFLGLGSVSTLYAQVGSSFDAGLLYPYGSGAQIYGGGTVFNGTALKKASPERIKMLLRIMDFLAAPFGTKEWELLNYGVEGTHFTRGSDGAPSVPTDLGKTESASNLPFKYIAQQPQPIFQPGAPQITQSIYNDYKALMPIVLANPAAAYTSGSAAYSANYAGLQAAMNSAVSDVVSGKASVSGWKDTAAQLRSQFKVAQMESELSAGYAANKS
jgi:putative aldouronate transport system substrate-binding protein